MMLRTPFSTRRRLARAAALALWVFCLAGLAPAPGPVRDVGDRLELFVDRFLIDAMEGTELRLHAPHPAAPSAQPPGPGHYATILRDGALYRLYQRGGQSSFDGDPRETTVLFESDDGIHWTAPVLDLYTVDGSRANNVVLAHEPPFSHNFTPFLDARPGVPPSERYKALAGTHESGLVAFASPDGLRWRKLQEAPVLTEGAFDSQNVAFWSPAEQRYVCYFRTWTGGRFEGLRTISRATSPDFLHWSEPVALHPNAEGEHLYTSAVHPYFRAPHLYVALPTRFLPDRGNATDILLLTSRAGAPFDRTFMEAFIRPGLEPAHWANRANYAAVNVIPTGPSELSIYVRGRRYVLRTDGFASVHAGYEEGEMRTHPLRFAGDSLTLNVSTSAAGHVAVEVQDEDGRPLPGFTAADADPVVGDAVAWTVTWRGDADVSALARRPVRLRFLMKEADLYALRFH